MKKYIVAIIVILFVGIAVSAFANDRPKKMGDFEVRQFRIDNSNYRLLVADTPEKWEKGLMFYRSLDGASGMMFLFPDTQTRTFWNKNTFLNLELFWLQDDKIVGKSYLPSIETSREIVEVNSPEPANRVVEFVK